MHQNGVNIRYLGRIAAAVKEKELNHLKQLFEREVVIRCMKHLLNKYIRECKSPELMSTMIAHVFNCLLAPKDFIKRLDEGKIELKP